MLAFIILVVLIIIDQAFIELIKQALVIIVNLTFITIIMVILVFILVPIVVVFVKLIIDQAFIIKAGYYPFCCYYYCPGLFCY